MLSVAADEHGLVAGGWRADAANGSSAAWTSPDGQQWTAAPWVPAFSGGQIPGVAARGRPRAGRRAVGLPGQQPGRRLDQPPAMSRMGPRGPSAVTLVSDLSLNDLLWVANTGPRAGGALARPRARRAGRPRSPGGSGRPPGPISPTMACRCRRTRPTPAASRGSGWSARSIQRLLVPGADPWTAGTTELLDAARFRLDEQGRIVADGDGLAGVRREPRAGAGRPRPASATASAGAATPAAG